ncbi:NIC-domain-containing protein [Periconia macrospinosa]|uniref:NIC-domain-containing protein n=1 Tax=Periconia macrospinosa TaxID=97972 RepID=A0A2V1DSX0_9PLEO|nr:NIC-domain-containing protein [Periconia macrospinosa]
MSLFGNSFGNKPASSAPASSGAPAFAPLFGGNTATTSSGSTPSLFSNLGGAQPAAGTSKPTSSLFGGTSGTAPAAAPNSGGLFSNLGASTSAAQPASQPTASGGLGTSLFGGGLGGTSTNTPASTATPALSLGGATAQAQPATSGFGGLFSKPAGQQTQPATSTNPQQTAGPAQPSLFGTSQAPQQPGGPLSQSNAGTGRSAHFDHLLERGRKRNAGENGLSNFDELPTLQLGLGDIARKVRNLGTGGPSADQAQDRAAHYLLSASGVKMASTLRDLNQFSTQAGFNATGAANNILDTDVDSYLSNLHSQSTLALIQEGLEQSKRDFDNFLEDNVQIEWDKQRQKIYEHFGLGRQSEEMAASQSTFGASTARGAFGRSARKGKSVGSKGASVNGASFAASQGPPPVIGSVMSPYGKRSINGDSQDKTSFAGQTGPIDRHTRDKQEQFMTTVKRLNEARLRETHFSVLEEFAEVEKSAASDNSSKLIDAYKALQSITGEKPGSEHNLRQDQPRERCYAADYLDEQPNSVRSVNIRKRILDGSRKYLEQKFLNHVKEVLSKNAHEARPGGAPSNINKIKGFVRAKVAHKELGVDYDYLNTIGVEKDEEYPWVTVFYLLRGGLTQDAAEYVQERKNFFNNTDRNFLPAVVYYANDPDRRLSPELQQKISNAHAQRVRIGPTNDPFRLACYKVLGRCELSSRNLSHIKEEMEDWIWLQFNLAREGNRAEENAGEIFGLDEIRATTIGIGQRHFMNDDSESSTNYGVYFYLATLAGLFEQAVNFLYQHNYISAVHFAIALDYYGLLRVSDWRTAGTEILTYTAKQLPQLNFGRVVGYYTGDFRAARPDAAAEYLVLICLNADLPGEAGRQQAELCHEALRELVLETREFSTLLGDVRSNGQSTPGLIQERAPLIRLTSEDALINRIIREAAKVADDNGRVNDAVLLNHLAGEYDSVMSILNHALSEALSVELGQEPLRLEPLRPRVTTVEQQRAPELSSSSLSMLATDDPVDLAEKVISLYNAQQTWWRKIQRDNRDTAGVLFQLNKVKKVIEAGRYMEALDQIENIGLLPLQANGNLSEIRSSANNFSQYRPEIARNIGNVLLWCIGCCSRHREVLLSGTYEDPTRRNLADQLLQKAKDLMVFAGLIRYKLPPRVFETLAREGGSVGAY